MRHKCGLPHDRGNAMSRPAQTRRDGPHRWPTSWIYPSMRFCNELCQAALARRLTIAVAMIVLTFQSVVPASAERRVALFVEYPSTQGNADASVTADFAETLRSRFGFDIIIARQPDQKQLLEKLGAFRQLLSDTEFAMLFISGRFEHDGNGTYALTSNGNSGELPSSVPLDDIFSEMVLSSRASVVVLEALDGAKPRPGLVAGLGRMPQIDDRLLISLAPGPLASTRTLGPSLGEMLGNSPDTRSLRPVRLIKALRDEVYLRSAGLRLVQTIGSLPLALDLGATVDRNKLLAGIGLRVQELCTTDYRQNRPRTEQKVLAHLAQTISGLRLAALKDNNNFILERLLDELQRSGSCPYLPPPQPPQSSSPLPTEVKATPPAALSAPTSRGNTGKATPEPPVAALPPPTPPGPSTTPREANRTPPPDDRKGPSTRQPQEPSQKKAQVEADEDPPAKQSGRSPRSSPPEKPPQQRQPPVRERTEPRSPPASPGPSRGPISVPF